MKLHNIYLNKQPHDKVKAIELFLLETSIQI